MWMQTQTSGDPSYRMLLCAETGDGRLHVALERPRVNLPDVEPGVRPRLPTTTVSAGGWRADGLVFSGQANLPGESIERVLTSGYLTLPPTGTQEVTVTHADVDGRVLLSATYMRVAAEQTAGGWRPQRPLREGYQLFGAAEGEKMFYVFCEGPYVPSAQDLAEPNSIGSNWWYTVFFADDAQQPPRYEVWPARMGPPQTATRTSLLLMVLRQPVTPTEFSVTITDPRTRLPVLEFEARHSPEIVQEKA